MTHQDEPACNTQKSVTPIYHNPSSSVRILACDGPLIPQVGHLRDPLERKRQAIWKNGPRNELVAKLAQAAKEQNVEVFWEVGLFLDDERIPFSDAGTHSVAVLVESPEHGRQLSKLLTGWPLIDASAVRNRRMKNLPTHGDDQHVIITLVAADQLIQFAPHYLIIAMGGPRAFDLSNYFPPNPYSQGLLIDIADDFDKLATNATRNRLLEYAFRSWSIEASAKWSLDG